MLLTVERVAQLRRVSLFSATPDAVLAGLAAAAEEVTFDADEVLIRAGEVEDWLFVIVTGEVEVARPDRVVRLGPGSVVGELAVLDPEERTATVTALTAAHTFRLDKPAFDAALLDRPEIARGVITELVRRVRERHDDPRP